MKKIYLLLGLNLLLLYSCQKDEIITENDESDLDYSSFEQQPFNSIPDHLQDYFFVKTNLKTKETPKSFGQFS